jgi:thymidylate kinase
VLAFLTTVVADSRAGYRFYHLRQSVRQSLNRYQRRNRLQAITTYFHEMWSRRNTFLRLSPSRQMTPVNGGMTLALVGADGAGKSTMSALLRKWLGWKLDVRTYYLGSKQPSRRSRALYMLFRMLRRSHSELTRRLDGRRVPARRLARLRDHVLYLYHLSIGHDRFARYQEGMKQAMTGSIVIFDRFPLESIRTSARFRLLDGPQISLDEDESGVIARKLADAEQRLYQAMRPPDVLLVLDVSPEVSLLRKPDHQEAAVEAKAQAINELIGMADLQDRGVNVIHFNADLPRETVLAQIQSRIWALI